MKLALVALLSLAALCAAQEAVRKTPHGQRPSDCVHTVPSGSHIQPGQGGVTIVFPNGTTEFLPEKQHCVEDAERIRQERLAARSGKPGNLSQWLDNVYWYPPGDTGLFNGRYTLPGDPKNSGGQTLYYFIGTENLSVGELSILQPVLTWYQGWSIASWNCCPSGQSHESTPIYGLTGGSNNVKGYIQESGTTWTITSNANSQTTTLSVDNNGREFDWVDVTLEIYDVETCDQHATGTMTFDQMTMAIKNGTTVTPSWSTPSATSCGGVEKVYGPDHVTITHTN